MTKQQELRDRCSQLGADIDGAGELSRDFMSAAIARGLSPQTMIAACQLAIELYGRERSAPLVSAVRDGFDAFTSDKKAASS